MDIPVPAMVEVFLELGLMVVALAVMVAVGVMAAVVGMAAGEVTVGAVGPFHSSSFTPCWASGGKESADSQIPSDTGEHRDKVL